MFRFDAPGRTTQRFPFSLRAGSSDAYQVGPVNAGPGRLDVMLSFPGDFVVLACVGTRSGCRPMGGRPTTATFDIPSDFPAGLIRASVYFNPNFPQPPGDATGTVCFTYRPL
jgi:hypothetical protein